MYFDMHSHILPGVDDGAKNIDEALALLELAQNNGISNIIATPHFYPNEVYFDEFLETTQNALKELNSYIKDFETPNIYMGCEVLYFRGLGNVDEIPQLTLNGSKYILIELTSSDINDYLFDDLLRLIDRGFIPIIAHIERYHHFKNYKKLLQFVVRTNIPIQINAADVLNSRYKRTIKNIFSLNVIYVIATDTHSVAHRPPLMREALEHITKLFGREQRDILLQNAEELLFEIIGAKGEK